MFILTTASRKKTKTVFLIEIKMHFLDIFFSFLAKEALSLK